MKKLIITMIAIAFSLSAYSEIYILEYGGTKGNGLTVWCVHEIVFVGGPRGGPVTQVLSIAPGGGTDAFKCDQYKQMAGIKWRTHY